MNTFMKDNFLLNGEMAVQLYHEYARDLPIIDYHCHLSPAEIYENKSYDNLTEVWLDGDHYKWRALRANGVEEQWITGEPGIDNYERFLAWAKTVPMTLGNPLYHWSHLELRRYFGIKELIHEKSAPLIWEKANAKLRSGKFGARDMISISNVETICTTDDPTDSLDYHKKISSIDGFTTKVLPTFRPDKGLEITRNGFCDWVRQLEMASEQVIDDYGHFLSALESRVRYFHLVGACVSDHALDEVVYEPATEEEVFTIFAKVLAGGDITRLEEGKYKGYTLVFLGKLYAELGWAMQLHIKAHRANNTRMALSLGPDTGFDSINDGPIVRPLVGLLDALERERALPRTIVYSLNPNDNEVLGTIIGSFQGGGIPGKMQLGSAWWFNDTKDGMINQLQTVANTGLLGRFIGMLTDSRSFLSYPRHEYFRRILCNLIGSWADSGDVPYDKEMLGELVERICYRNAKEYFRF